jgi:hypothetical protein
LKIIFFSINYFELFERMDGFGEFFLPFLLLKGELGI